MQSLSVPLHQHAVTTIGTPAAAWTNLCVLVTVCCLALVTDTLPLQLTCVCVLSPTLYVHNYTSHDSENYQQYPQSAINIPNDNNDRDHTQTRHNRSDTTFPFTQVGQASCPIHKHSHMSV